MSGMAQARFFETQDRPLIKEIEKIHWPTLDLAVNVGALSYIDLAFTEFLLRDFPETDEAAAAFLCHLSKCSREGHLCVRKEKNEIHPSPAQIWSLDSGDPLPKEVEALINLMEQNIAIPDKLVSVIDDPSSNLLKPICRFNALYYLQKYWVFESSLKNHLNTLLNQKPSLAINRETVTTRVNEMLLENRLNKEQVNAITQSTQGCFSIICGGPGTGKTYTAGHLIRIILDSLGDEQRENCEIVLAAPTGKAANALQMSLEKALKNLPNNIKSKTLHSLLEIRTNRRFSLKSPKKLTADIILVDESSMIDIGVFSTLLSSVKSGARLIMLGDPFQLPPVESGSAFKDVITLLNGRSPGKYIFPLKTCLRAELKEIIDFSEKVNSSDIEGVLQKCNDGAISRINLPIDDEPKKAREWLLNHAVKAFPSPVYQGQDPLELIEAFNNFRLLSPLRKGPLGVEAFNVQMYQKMRNEVKWNDKYVVPIMVVSNDYKRELFNGEVGVLIRRKTNHSTFQPGDEAYFSSGDGKSCRRIPAILLPRFEYAYCLSVHKSQGSEFNNVFLLLPKGSEKFGREVFYTAVTRTKQKLEICSSNETIRNTLLNQSDRLSGISDVDMLNN